MTASQAESPGTISKGIRKRLGRGLGSLISAPVRIDADPGVNRPTASPYASAGTDATRQDDTIAGDDQIRSLPLQQVHANPRQPRQDFDDESLRALAASIRNSGMMQPIVVRPDRKGGYQIVAGERRWRASQQLGLERIAAIVRDVDDKTAAQFSLVENLQREDLNPIERAEAFQRLVDEFGLMHQEIADSVGIDRSSVTNHLRLNELDDNTKDAVRADRLSMGHAKALLALTNISVRAALATQAVQRAWSVRELERHAKAAGEGRAAQSAQADSTASATPSLLRTHLTDLQKRLSEHLGTKVRIRPGRKKGSGSMTIDFYTLDQFEGLLTRLQFQND
jgi:ParB family transcriptional regulator, chromosome partitioning protein